MPSPLDQPAKTPAVALPRGPQFADVLREKTHGVQFSGHAIQRVQRRGIEVVEPELARLQEGVDRAAGKGARESVIFVDSTAFVVSVRNRTVITAVDRDHMKDHVFTNIDSAVIA
jgi:flagellar operon protein